MRRQLIDGIIKLLKKIRTSISTTSGDNSYQTSRAYIYSCANQSLRTMLIFYGLINPTAATAYYYCLQFRFLHIKKLYFRLPSVYLLTQQSKSILSSRLFSAPYLYKRLSLRLSTKTLPAASTSKSDMLVY